MLGIVLKILHQMLGVIVKKIAGNLYNSTKNIAFNSLNHNKKVAENIYNGTKYYGGKALKTAWKNKGSILDVAGKAAYVYGVATANPIARSVGVAMSGVGQAIKEGEAKDALAKELEERKLGLYGNRYISYSDFPRIHYSRKPFGYGMPNFISPHLYRKPNYFMMEANNPKQSPLALVYKEQKDTQKPKSKPKKSKKGVKKK